MLRYLCDPECAGAMCCTAKQVCLLVLQDCVQAHVLYSFQMQSMCKLLSNLRMT